MTLLRDEAWLEERRKGVGASDAPVLAGLSPYKTTHELYLEKRGILPPGPMSPEQEWGLRLEPVVAAAYEDRCGLKVQMPETKIVWSREYPFLFCSPDRLRADGRNVQLKTSRTGDGWGEEGTDEVPEHILLQTQQEMLVLGVPVTDVPVLIGGSDFRVYTVHFSPTLGCRATELAFDFMESVRRNIPPPLDYTHPSALELVKRLYGVAGDLEIELASPEVVASAEEYLTLGQDIKELQSLRDGRKALLLDAMKEAAIARLPNGFTLKRRICKNPGHTTKPYEYVMFKAQPPKEKE